MISFLHHYTTTLARCRSYARCGPRWLPVTNVCYACTTDWDAANKLHACSSLAVHTKRAREHARSWLDDGSLATGRLAVHLFFG
jgi:hypothetical protein